VASGYLLTMRSLLSFHKLGVNNRHGTQTPRIWLSSQRLDRIGFGVGSRYRIDSTARGLSLISDPKGARIVSSFKRSARATPIIDINSMSLLGSLAGTPTLKMAGSYGRIDLSPSLRSLQILRRLKAPTDRLRVVELFCGGGTMSAAISAHPQFQMVAGVEVEGRYSDVWQAAHSEACLISGDLRDVHPNEIPHCDIVVAGIPCTDHSIQGRAKKSLKGRPESGVSGGLFSSVLSLIAAKMPSACLFENVFNYGTSLAGDVLRQTLASLGYHVYETVLEPSRDWNQVSNRRRWVMIATLKPGFALTTPETSHSVPVSAYLDAPNPEQDRADAFRIAGSMAGLARHRDRHAAKGNKFDFTVLDGTETIIPTIMKSYHKINTGPFLATPYGARLLRKGEIERIMGHEVDSAHYATAVEVLGQGVQTQIFAEVFRQIGAFLSSSEIPVAASMIGAGQTELF
jgi:DNA (cytosine-5)-methyltransferase 1